jgi:hypothetical protein
MDARRPCARLAPAQRPVCLDVQKVCSNERYELRIASSVLLLLHMRGVYAGIALKNVHAMTVR